MHICFMILQHQLYTKGLLHQRGLRVVAVVDRAVVIYKQAEEAEEVEVVAVVALKEG